LFKVAFFCLGLMLAAVPLAASAQVTAPTPAPVAPDAAKPTPAPPERFISSAGGFSGKTYNELAPGASTGGWGIRAVDELPIIGHNWVAQIDYRSYGYTHTAPAGTAGITFACPTGSSACVTPIGYQTYNRVFGPGPSNYVNSLAAQDSTTQIGLGSKIAPIERFYLSVGYVFKSSNYLGYPTESGMGFGLDKLPDVDRALSFYGNFWVYFNVNGAYTGPTAAGLGGLSAYPFTVAYRLFAYRFGATFNIPKTPVFVDLSDIGDRADVSASAPSDSTHNMLFLGAGVKF
jgi:hypothetical protein